MMFNFNLYNFHEYSFSLKVKGIIRWFEIFDLQQPFLVVKGSDLEWTIPFFYPYRGWTNISRGWTNVSRG